MAISDWTKIIKIGGSSIEYEAINVVVAWEEDTVALE